MRKLYLIVLLLVISFSAKSWGQTGHRIVGYIAEQYLSKKAKKELSKVLDNKTLAEISNDMDYIKSDPAYDHMKPWHYSTIPDGKTYAEVGTPEEGDAIATIERILSELESGSFTDQDELFALKILVHLIGDIHQPLHVGNGKDRGGNDVKLEYFWQKRNLHSVWDSGIIDQQAYSYTEYANWINHPRSEQVDQWQSSTVRDWAVESMSYRDRVYDLPENMKISYRYNYDNIDLVNQRLLQAGVRLAAVLNKTYG